MHEGPLGLPSQLRLPLMTPASQLHGFSACLLHPPIATLAGLLSITSGWKDSGTIPGPPHTLALREFRTSAKGYWQEPGRHRDQPKETREIHNSTSNFFKKARRPSTDHIAPGRGNLICTALTKNNLHTPHSGYLSCYRDLCG